MRVRVISFYDKLVMVTVFLKMGKKNLDQIRP